MTALHVIHLDQVPILQQLQWEEALLRADERNWCLINQGSPPAIVMGISGKLEQVINQERLRSKFIPVIRRFSGGGTVVIDEQTLFITFICNSSFIPIQPYPQPIMRWTETLYRPFFHPHPFELRENDYVMGHQKCGGNAQSIGKNRWLHHSSFLWDYSQAHMDYLLMPPKMPAYRQMRSHGDFLCRLKDYWPCPKQFKERFLDHIGRSFCIREGSLVDLQEAASHPHRQATERLC